MANINEKGFLLESDRLFIPSADINVFPCSRRGQSSIEGSASHHDPEARLNTERTNRLHTAINGFKDSFIIGTTNNILTFVLAGYRVEVKNFNASAIAEALGATNADTLYAHLRLRTDVSLDIEGYFTEILARQSTSANNKNYLDVYYEDTTNNLSNDFFVGISFAKIPIESTTSATLVPKNLPLFSYSGGEWKLVQASLLPKIDHDSTENSIKLYGDFTIEHGEGEEKQTSFKVKKDKTTLGPTEISKLTVTDTAEIYGATTINNDVTANNITINKNEDANGVIVGGTVKTPVLDTWLLTSTYGNLINVGKDLVIADDLSVIVDNIQADTIKSRAANGTVTVDSPTKLNNILTAAGKTTLQNGLEVTNGDTKLGKLSAAATDVASLSVTGSATLQNGLEVTAGDTKLKKLSAGATDVASIAVTGATTLNNGLTVSAGDTTVKNIKADTTSVNNLTVDTTTKLNGTVSINGETTIANSLSVTGTNGITTPSLKVDTVDSKSTAADTSITVKKPVRVEGGATITGATVIDNKLTVDNLTVEPAGKIDVKTITNTASGDTAVTIEKGLTVTDKATLNNGLNVANGVTTLRTLEATELDVAVDKLVVTKDNATFKAPVTIDTTLAATGKATLNSGLEVTSGTTTLQGLTAGATTLGNLTVNNVTVTGTNNVSTPTLKADTITTKSAAAVTVDKPLKATSTLDVSGKTTLKNTDVTGTLNVVGTATTDELTTDDLSVVNDAEIGNKLTATELALTGKGQVPALEIAHLTATDTYQLRFKFGKPITIIEE